LNVPAIQLVHATAEDAVNLNLPAAQAVTVLPLPVKPASAVQSSIPSEASRLLLLEGQAWQSAAVKEAETVL
jgi:hypothetical protein